MHHQAIYYKQPNDQEAREYQPKAVAMRDLSRATNKLKSSEDLKPFGDRKVSKNILAIIQQYDKNGKRVVAGSEQLNRPRFNFETRYWRDRCFCVVQ